MTCTSLDGSGRPTVPGWASHSSLVQPVMNPTSVLP